MRPAIALALAFLVALLGGPSQALPNAGLPARVLITNDDGIAEPKIAVLAQAFAEAGVEVWVVAADADRSGYSNFSPAANSGRFRVRPADLGPGIHAFELQGAPADCVLFALTGPLRDRLPDLVVSGPNGGDNAGDAWIGSGTIGAARLAAYWGIPAIAVSGVTSDDRADQVRASAWVVALSRTRIVRTLAPPYYLTVAFPEDRLDGIRGVEIVNRASNVIGATAAPQPDSDGWTTWALSLTRAEPDRNTDVAALARGFIVVSPMRAGDAAPSGLDALRRHRRALPVWSQDSAP